MTTMKMICRIFCCLLMLICSFKCAATNQPTIVQTNYGDILGYQTEMARVFYGIPYARPPLDQLRWSPPVPVEKWTPKVINATSPTPACPQPPCNSSSPWCPPAFSEDCLYLNVFTPRTNRTSLPVMIFITGGEFQLLDASLPIYYAERFVNTTNVIVAFVQYRLGILGFLATGSNNNDLRGNYGILDQRLGIAWIKANIDAFGGDPNQITLFGQSAGGQSVALHFVNPDMQSFFQRAIIQSAPMTIPFRTYDDYITPGVLFADQLHCAVKDIACFRAVSVDRIIEAQIFINGLLTSFNALLFFEPWLPVIDHQIVTGQLYETILNVSFPLKPLIIGTVLDEGLFFIYKQWTRPMTVETYLELGAAFFGEKSLKVLERFPPDFSGDQRPLLSKIATEWIFVCSQRIFARRSAWFSYVFAFPPQTASNNINPFCIGHVCHGDELAFLFESSWTNFTDAERHVSQSIATYWTNFAKTNDVNTPMNVSLNWSRTSSNNEEYLYFQNPLELRENYLKSDCDFWDEIGYRK